ncbi:MAG: hypothetical protein LBC12_00350 [Nitrososphaerota archaeon]|jgi:hypothetical protein|nr:hypothetical protein [Nitrososphaerota archaeon]
MMILSCVFYKPQMAEVVNIITQKGSYPYGADIFRLYVKEVYEQTYLVNDVFGKFVDVYYDDKITIREMNEKLEVMVNTRKILRGPKKLCVFYKKPLRDIIGIFAGGFDSDRIKHCISAVANKQYGSRKYDPLSSLCFKLKDKEAEINSIDVFENVIEISATGIKDPYVSAARLKGSAVNESEEYLKLVRDPVIGGDVECMAVSYKNKTYFLFSNGRVFTRQAAENVEQEAVVIHEIVEKLHSVDAVQI